jgi:tRNA 2-thiouridine synthesizing protein A
MQDAGFDKISFSERRYDTFSDAPSASSAAAFGTRGVNIRAVKPIGPRRSRKPAGVSAKVSEPADSAGSEPPVSTTADALFDAGSLGCGDGPLMEIAVRLRRMTPGAVLEVRSTDPGVAADLPAWCRMTGHTYLGGGEPGDPGRYFVRRRDG